MEQFTRISLQTRLCLVLSLDALQRPRSLSGDSETVGAGDTVPSRRVYVMHTLNDIRLCRRRRTSELLNYQTNKLGGLLHIDN